MEKTTYRKHRTQYCNIPCILFVRFIINSVSCILNKFKYTFKFRHWNPHSVKTSYKDRLSKKYISDDNTGILKHKTSKHVASVWRNLYINRIGQQLLIITIAFILMYIDFYRFSSKFCRNSFCVRSKHTSVYEVGIV